MPDNQTAAGVKLDSTPLLAAIADLERAAEDCGYYCEPPDDCDNSQLADARRRRGEAGQRIDAWIQANNGLGKQEKEVRNE